MQKGERIIYRPGDLEIIFRSFRTDFDKPEAQLKSRRTRCQRGVLWLLSHKRSPLGASVPSVSENGFDFAWKLGVEVRLAGSPKILAWAQAWQAHSKELHSKVHASC